jgi:hypothetical protein
MISAIIPVSLTLEQAETIRRLAEQAIEKLTGTQPEQRI